MSILSIPADMGIGWWIALAFALVFFIAAPPYTRWRDSKHEAKGDRQQAERRRKVRMVVDAKDDPLVASLLLSGLEAKVSEARFMTLLNSIGATGALILSSMTRDTSAKLFTLVVALIDGVLMWWYYIRSLKSSNDAEWFKREVARLHTTTPPEVEGAA